jgi:hypothetical protein
MNVKFQGIVNLRTRAYIDYQIQFQLAFTLVMNTFVYYLDYPRDIHVTLKVKPSRYRPGVAQRVPGS